MSTGTTVAGTGTVTFTRSEPGAPRRAAELVDRAGELARELRDQLVLGSLRTLDRDLEAVVRGERTAPRPPAAPLCGVLGLTNMFPLSPSLEGVLRLAAAATTARPEGDLAPYWRIATLTRPFTGGGGPGAGETVRFEELDFPATLTHEPTRRFLREVGLPEDGFLFQLDAEVALPTLPEYYAESCAPPPRTELPAHADRLIRLGRLTPDTHLVVDGATGTILCWSEPDRTLRPLNADISTLAFTVWLVHRERGLDVNYDLTPFQSYLTAVATGITRN
ncbi:hypothetical protein GCM10010145_23980 [Streptomyces ruber]|uniref:SUKH-4 immunity protein of toxin-antitoxin system n=2 Tax=Streptomyces TaxID=1883 RepID=A0A918BAP6_9ACTN|nr:SUKH-4 family immunity protein [Streptomyces ruber]GGQ53812.1 hypothetical protein GCM10010145_23980 [Streptomyces ruber]